MSIPIYHHYGVYCEFGASNFASFRGGFFSALLYIYKFRGYSIRGMRLIGLVLLMSILSGAAHAGSDPCGAERKVQRTVVAFFDASRESEPRDTRIHRYLELPLNHLGYRLVFVDPSDTDALASLSADIAATVTWFDAPLPQPAAFASAMARLAETCLFVPRALIFDHPGMVPGAADERDWTRYLDRVGAKPRAFPGQTGFTDVIQVLDTALIGGETKFLNEPLQPVHLDLADGGGTHLRIGSAHSFSDLVTTGAAGAFVHRSAAIAPDPRGGDFWITDPFALLHKVLGEAVTPVPDITTRNGRRVYFSTVSPSGWLATMPLRKFGDTAQSVPEVLRDLIFMAQTDLPVTLSVLTGDFDPELVGPAGTSARNVASQLLTQPNVQPATSGATFIQDWNFFREYEPEREAARLTSANTVARSSNSMVSEAAQRLGGVFAQTDASAFSHTPDAPRKYHTRPFDLSAETAGALEAAQRIARPGAPPAAFIWSGDARPFEAALAAVNVVGAKAIGGGGGICTAEAPSIANIWPHSAPVGEQTQVYHALSGAAVYTGRGGAPHRFQALADTLDCTETPRRLKAFQLAYSVESAFHFGLRQSILKFLDRARSDSFIPLTVAEYVASVESFADIEFSATERTEWTVSNLGAITTIRFDNAAHLGVDMSRSLNTLGARRHGTSLYVALEPGSATARISLKPTDDASGVILAGLVPALSESSLSIKTVSKNACTIIVSASGFAPGLTVWSAAPRTSYAVTVTEKGAPDDRVFWGQITASDTGELRVPVPVEPGRPLDITLSPDC